VEEGHAPQSPVLPLGNSPFVELQEVDVVRLDPPKAGAAAKGETAASNAADAKEGKGEGGLRIEDDLSVGLAAEIDTTFTEIERRGKSAEDLALLLRDLDAAAQRRDVESAALAAKSTATNRPGPHRPSALLATTADSSVTAAAAATMRGRSVT